MAQNSASFDSELGRLADAARREEASLARRQRADRSMAAGLSGTFAGTLTELTESKTPVTLLTRTGGTIRGTIITLGSDVVVVSPAGSASRILVRSNSIEGVRESGSGHDRNDSPDGGPSFAELLDEFSADNDRVALTLSSGNRLMGAVLRVGIDQVVLRLDGEADSMSVPLHKIDQVVSSR